MVLKTYQLAPETKKIEGKRFPDLQGYLLFHKMRALKKGIIIPDNLIAELEEYSSRNYLPELSSQIIKCCPDCLKAHAMVTAREFGLDSRATSFLSTLLNGKAGHNGHYLDKERVVSMSRLSIS